MMFRTPYNYDTDKVSLETGLACPEGSSMTVQSDAIDADINEIVRRFGLTRELPIVDRPPGYGDFEGVSDYHQAMNLIADANSAFMELPAEVRYRFDNNPGKYVDFCENPENLEEMRKLGIALPAEREIIELPIKVEVVNNAEGENGSNNGGS